MSRKCSLSGGGYYSPDTVKGKGNYSCRSLTLPIIEKSTFFFLFAFQLLFLFLNWQRTEYAFVAVSVVHIEVVRDKAKPTLYKEIVGFLNVEHSQLLCTVELFISGWLLVTVHASVPPTLVFPLSPPPEEHWHLEGVTSPPFDSSITLVKSH